MDCIHHTNRPHPPPGRRNSFFTISNVSSMISVTIVPKKHTLTSGQNKLTSHHIPRETYLDWFCISFPNFFFNCIILYSQFTVVLPSYGPARRHSHAICEHQVLLARFFRQHAAAQRWWRTGHVQKTLLTGRRRGVNGTGLRQWGMQGYTQDLRGLADTSYLSIYLLRRARRSLHLYPPKHGDRPHTAEFIRSSVVPITTTAAVAVTRYAAVAYRSPVTTL